MVIVTDIVTNMKNEMIDIHNHSLPFVDDGSSSFEMTKEILKKSIKDNIKTIFLTPHANSSVTKAKRSFQKKIYDDLINKLSHLEINLILGSEIFISSTMPKIDFSEYTMGETNFLLVEFSTHIKTDIVEHVYNIKMLGFDVIVAHVERYDYLTIDDIYELKELGAYLQVNSNSIINKRNKERYKKIRNLLKNNLIDFVATDCHNITSRPPNLKDAYLELQKLVSKTKANDLVFRNAYEILLKNIK